MSETKLEFDGKTFVFDSGNENSVIKLNGKFNSVFKGICAETNQPVIIKKLNDNLRDLKNIEHFKREFLFNINHKNIVKTLAYIEFSGNHYIIREFADGVDLKTLSQQKKLKVDDIINYVLNILDALNAMHKNEIIHCDIRPANIIVNIKTNEAKLIDLGLAKRKNDLSRNPFALIYSSPEQLLNIAKLVNETSDLYSMGIVMYELLTGKIPFHHSNPELLMNIQFTQILQPHKNIHEQLFNVINKATFKHQFKLPPKYFDEEKLIEFLSEAQQKRFQNTTEMKDEIVKARDRLQKSKPDFGKNILIILKNYFYKTGTKIMDH